MTTRDDFPDALWRTCAMVGEGIDCEGYGKRDLGERFTVSANGALFEVLVTAIQYGDGVRWEAMDVARYEARYRVPSGMAR